MGQYFFMQQKKYVMQSNPLPVEQQKKKAKQKNTPSFAHATTKMALRKKLKTKKRERKGEKIFILFSNFFSVTTHFMNVFRFCITLNYENKINQKLYVSLLNSLLMLKLYTIHDINVVRTNVKSPNNIRTIVIIKIIYKQ